MCFTCTLLCTVNAHTLVSVCGSVKPVLMDVGWQLRQSCIDCVSCYNLQTTDLLLLQKQV